MRTNQNKKNSSETGRAITGHLFPHGTIIGARVTCKKITCYMTQLTHSSACW